MSVANCWPLRAVIVLKDNLSVPDIQNGASRVRIYSGLTARGTKRQQVGDSDRRAWSRGGTARVHIRCTCLYRNVAGLISVFERVPSCIAQTHF